jgi:ligand-binding sensor domain-containing protein
MNKILVFLLLFSFLLNAQQVIGWQNYTDMKDIKDLEIRDNIVWAATNGGVFSFSISDSSYQLYTKSENLSSHSITSIAIDKDNKIWIGTLEGFIDVLDPNTNEVKTILQIFKTDKNNKRINDIQISGDTAFVSTEFGLSLINTNDLSFFDSILKFGNFTSETPVKNIFIGNTIYVVTQAGIARKKTGFNNLAAPESWTNDSIGVNIPVNTIYKLTEYNNQLHIGTNDGVFRLNSGVWEQRLYDNFDVTDFQIQGESLYSVLLTTIHKFNQTDEVIYRSENSFLQKLVFYDEESFIGTSKGLIQQSGSGNKIVKPNTPETNAFISITVDSDGNLWAATGKDNNGIGVLKFDRDNWQTINKESNPQFRINDFHIVSSSKNAVYLSTWGRGFIKYQNNEYEVYDDLTTDLVGIPEANSFLVINNVQEDTEENTWLLNYWAADRKPISVITPENNIFSYEFDSPLFPTIVNVTNLVIDENNTKWFAGDFNGDVATDGLFYFNENGTLENLSDDVWGKLSQSNGLRNRDVRALAIDKFGELIIGTSVGVDVIPNTSDPSFVRGDQYFSMRQQTINCIVVDPLNQKWFGTEKGIFLTSSDGSFLLANYNKTNSPLPSDNIKSLAMDNKNGIVYAGTDFGITAISTMFNEPNENFSELFVYPNPVILSSTNNTNIIIDGLIENSEIKILDISGNLINEFRAIGGKTTFWDCRDFNGRQIASGVYLVVAFDSEANEVGHAKFAVIKK